MLRNDFLRKLFQIQRHTITIRSSSSKIKEQINIQQLENEEAASGVTEEQEILDRNKKLERKRNKSGLSKADYRTLHEQNPYPQAKFSHHGTLRYMRRTYGRYGASSGVNPTICWPVKEELQEAMELERVKYPYTISQMIQEAKAQREEKEQSILQRQQDIRKKMLNLEQWKQELNAKIEKKESEAMEAKMRKDRLIEEVKRHFGYTVDPRDDRFKELLEKKEKEQKKAMKEARKKAKEAQMVKKLLTKHKAADEEEKEEEGTEDMQK